MEGRNPQILWPKSSQKREWETTDLDLVLLLEQQKGPVERKLENMGIIIYSYGAEVWGKEQDTEAAERPFKPAEVQREIDRLVKEKDN